MQVEIKVEKLMDDTTWKRMKIQDLDFQDVFRVLHPITKDDVTEWIIAEGGQMYMALGIPVHKGEDDWFIACEPIEGVIET